jgi:hypothetical protein
MEWLRMINKYNLRPLMVGFYLSGESLKWWDNLDEDTRLSLSWEEFEKLFSDKWIRDTKMEEMYRIQDEIK